MPAIEPSRLGEAMDERSAEPSVAPVHDRPDAQVVCAAGTSSTAQDSRCAPRHPVTRLSDHDREGLRAHLVRLSRADRGLRFGGDFPDEWLRQYAEGIDFRRDVVLAERDAEGEIVGVAEMRGSSEAPEVREIAFSVDPRERGRGRATSLVAAALEHARREGVASLHGLVSAGNAAMLRILERAGFAFARQGLDVSATLVLGAQKAVAPAASRACDYAAPATPCVETFMADDGERIRVACMGAGRPIVLLHGFGLCDADWRPVAHTLAHDHHVLAWHARGHRRSAAQVNTRPTVERLGDDLAQLIEHFGLDQPVLAGHSMGALVALQYLRSHGSDNVGALCIVDQSPRIVTTRGWSLGFYGRFARRQSQRFVEQLRADFPESVLRLLALGLNAKAREEYLLDSRHIVRARRALRERDGDALAHLFASLAAADFRSLIPTIDCPVLVVLGGRSNLFPARELAAYWRAALRRACVETYPAADHFPHRTHAERFVTDLRAFVARASRAREREGCPLRICNAASRTTSLRDRGGPEIHSSAERMP